MQNTTEKPSAEQRAFLSKLILSSTFTAEEAHRTAIWLNSPRATKEKATEIIDKALARIKKRDADRKASADRKAAFHENKANGGEYPPKRYSQDHPPNGGNSPNGKPPESAPVPAPVPEPEKEQKIYRINGVDYTDKNKAAAAASKAIFG